MKINDANLKTHEDGTIAESVENFEPMKKLLDNTGCGFCLAKWNQVTTHLGSGITHSCHHVGAHKIPLVELETNPSALHNTLEKKERRKEMLSGKRPTECDYCWRIEDSGEYSDRVQKSLTDWATIDHDNIIAMTGDENVNPRYMEVSFSNVCNFKCAYCGPPFSSKWAEEVRSEGPYKLHMTHYNGIKEHEVQIPTREHNPYIEAFWEWFPDAVKDMKVFRITGGEPLLSKDTWRVIDYLIENPQPELRFSINTNSCPPDDLWEKFVGKLKQLEEVQAVKEVVVFTSAEAVGKQLAYSRHGLNWNVLTKNVRLLLDNTYSVRLSFMSAVNLYSVPTFKSYIYYILDLMKRYNTTYKRVKVDFAYVRHPYFLDIKIVPRELLDKYIRPAIGVMKNNKGEFLFSDWEVQRIARIYKDCVLRYEKNEPRDMKDISLNRFRFWQFTEQYDQRRQSDFKTIFPELVDFLQECKTRDV
jgi:organic radical activating enzyme